MAARADNVDVKRGLETKSEEKLKDEVIASLLGSRQDTNWSLIERLTANLLMYLESENIPCPPAILAQLKASTPADKIAFIKLALVPRIHGLRGLIRDHADSLKLTVDDSKIDKVARYLQAMAEVAEA